MLELSVEKNGKVDVLDERDLASKEIPATGGSREISNPLKSRALRPSSFAETNLFGEI
jgi:hypothetical protein